MYRVEVIADASGKWVGNGLKFETVSAATLYATDLMLRWTLVRDWRVLDSGDYVIQTRSDWLTAAETDGGYWLNA